MKFTDKELHEMAEKNRKATRSNGTVELYGENYRRGGEPERKIDPAGARQRMLDRMATNPDRHSAAAEEARKQREAEKQAQRDYDRMSLYEQGLARRKAEEDRMYEVKARIAGYRSAAEYDKEREERREGHSYYDRFKNR